MCSTKKCSGCEKTYPKTTEFFHSNGTNRFRPNCKNCTNISLRNLRKEGKLKKRDRTEYCKKRYAENKPRIKKINRRTYLRRKLKKRIINDDEKAELELLVEELKNWK